MREVLQLEEICPSLDQCRCNQTLSSWAKFEIRVYIFEPKYDWHLSSSRTDYNQEMRHFRRIKREGGAHLILNVCLPLNSCLTCRQARQFNISNLDQRKKERTGSPGDILDLDSNLDARGTSWSPGRWSFVQWLFIIIFHIVKNKEIKTHV